MTNTILLKRSSVAGKIPTTAAVSIGELALNTYDGRLYTNINNGASTIVMLGGAYSYAGDLTASITGVTTLSLTLNSIATPGTYSNVVVNAKGLITSGSALTWSNLGYTPVNKAGDTMTGVLVVSQSTGGLHLLDSPSAGQYRVLGYTTGGLNRWNFGADNSAESGSNAGSNLYLTRYSDAGSILGTVMAVTRSTGAMNIYNGLTVTNGASADSLFVTGTLVATAFQGSFVGSVGAAVAWASPMTLAHSGDVTGTASFTGATATTISMTLAASGVTAGTYNTLTVNSKGLVTYGTLANVVISGDIGGAGTGTILASYVAGITPFSIATSTIPFLTPISVTSNGSIFCVINNTSPQSWGVSSDGLNWTSGTLPALSIQWSDLAYNGSIFCSVGYYTSLALTSPDGINWTQRTLPASLTWQSVAAKGSLFCAIGYLTNLAATSSDGVTWAQRTLSSSYGWQAITSNGSVFCAVGIGSTSTTSPDGITWTSGTLPASLSWTSIANNGSLFCAVAWGGSIAATSADGLSWTPQTLPASLNWTSVANVGSVFCAVASNNIGTKPNLAATSTDGINWTSRALSINYIVCIAGDSTAFCAIAQGSPAKSIRIIPYAASSSLKLSTPRTIAYSGDITGSTLFDGSSNVTIATTLANSGVTAGTYNSVIVNTKGLVTSAGVLPGNGGPFTFTGDATGTGTGTIALTLAASGASAGTYSALVVNAKGLVTAGANMSVTGDVTGTSSGAGLALTLAASGVTAGTYDTVVVNSKGIVTSASNVNTAVTGDATGSGLYTLAVTLATVVSAGTYSKVSVNAKGLVTLGSTISWTDLGYTPVNKTGDTMTGALTTTTLFGNISNALVDPAGGSTVVNSLSAWLGNITGNPAPWVQTTTVYNLVSAMIGTYPVSSMFGGGAVQYQSAICGAVNVPASDTGGNANTGVSGYGLSSSTLTGAVGVFGMGACNANNVSAWGANFLVTNSSTQGAPAGSGHTNNVLYGIEIDFNIVTATLGATPNAPTRGIYMIGGGNVQPIGGFYAIDIDSPGFTNSPRIVFDAALRLEDASCTNALDIGCTGKGAGVGSQNIILRGRTPATMAVNCSIACDPYGNLVLSPGSGGLISLATISSGISLNTMGTGPNVGSQYLYFNGQDSGGTYHQSYLVSDATGDFIVNGQGSVALQTNGTSRLQVLPWAVNVNLPMFVTGGVSISGGLTVSGSLSAPTFTGALVGNANTAIKWSAPMTLTASGDITGTGSFDGSSATNISMTLAATGVTAGTYSAVVVNTKGLVTSASNPTLTITGSVLGLSSGTTINTTLANSGVSAGTWNKVVVNAQGIVTSASKTYPIPPLYGTIVGTASTGTFALSNTLPISTIGTALWTATYTPSSTTSVLELSGSFVWDAPTANLILTGAIFRGSTCVGAISQTHGNGTTNLPDIMTWNMVDAPASTSPIVYSMRVGLSTSGAWYAGKTTSNNLGGALGSNIYVIQEYVP